MADTYELFSSNELTDMRDLFALVQAGDTISLSANDDLHPASYSDRPGCDDYDRAREEGIMLVNNAAQWSVWTTEVIFKVT